MFLILLLIIIISVTISGPLGKNCYEARVAEKSPEHTEADTPRRAQEPPLKNHA